jgi:hypothetical protein
MRYNENNGVSGRDALSMVEGFDAVEIRPYSPEFAPTFTLWKLPNAPSKSFAQKNGGRDKWFDGSTGSPLT